jgi:formate hydrogenlyase subunit 3/multisubunit Na+/H+ antiporter MnhD subunit
VVEVLLLTLIAGPVLAGVATIVATRFPADPPRRERMLSVVPPAIAALAVLGLLALLPWAGSDLALSVEWLPGSGRMVIGLGATGLYAALATTAGCALALLGSRARGSVWPGALALLSVGAAQVAYLTEHFLARYVALEVVALCVALAPLAELSGTADGPDADGHGGRLARLVYLVLRLGDVGLLVAVLMLWSAGGTLDIASALEAGQALDPARLNWVVAGFLLAVWVKVGGWPVHLWQQVGRRLTGFSQSWLYATVMPNLGLYLLYRVTPLLVRAGPLKGAAYWVGAAGAALAAILALATKWTDLRSALVYLGAALGGLALVLAACGLKTAVWMTALVLTPLRLLLYLAGDVAPSMDTAQAGASPMTYRHAGIGRTVVGGCFATGSLALAAYSLLCTWWARQAGAPLDALLVTEWAVALIGIWVARTAWRLWRAPVQHEMAARGISFPRWATLTLLGGGVLAGTLFFGPLARHLAAVAHGDSLLLPTPLALVRHIATTPAFWTAVVLAVAIWRLRLRPQRASLELLESMAAGEQALSLEEGLAQAAQVLSTVVEVGIQERILGGIVRAVLGGARLTRHVVEQQVLEGATNRVTQVVVGGGQLAYRMLEQDGLEGLLRGAVRGALAASRWMQRRHTGRLRRNLLWVVASLILAVLALALYGW